MSISGIIFYIIALVLFVVSMLTLTVPVLMIFKAATALLFAVVHTWNCQLHYYMGFMNEQKNVRAPKDESSFSKIKTLILSMIISIVAGVIYVLLIVE